MAYTIITEPGYMGVVAGKWENRAGLVAIDTLGGVAASERKDQGRDLANTAGVDLGICSAGKQNPTASAGQYIRNGLRGVWGGKSIRRGNSPGRWELPGRIMRSFHVTSRRRSPVPYAHAADISGLIAE